MTRISNIKASAVPLKNIHSGDIVKKWAQYATPTSAEAEKLHQSVLFAIGHLHQPGAALHRLDLSASGLTRLPPVVVWQQLEGITILDLSDNNLPADELRKLSALTSLKQLYISYNPLCYLPIDALSGNESLAILEAEACMLHNIPENISQLYDLDRLNLRDNPLQSLPENIGYTLRNLAEIDIRSTSIAQLPESLAHQQHLTIHWK
jgi:Leucine-rich repeat (LRR) protein